MNIVRNIYQLAKQAIAGFGTITELPLESGSYATSVIKLSNSTYINDREDHPQKILEDYARNYKNADSKDQDKINTSIIKIFHKMTFSQEDPGTSFKYVYYKCVNNVAENLGFDVTPELIYDRLLRRTTDPKDHPRGISSLASAFAAIVTLSLHREGTPESNLKYNRTSPYFDLSPLYGANEMETDSIRMKDGRGMLWQDCFSEERLDMLPDSVPALLVLWNRYHNYVAEELLWHNNHQWNNPNDLTPEQCLAQDNEIFHVARSITCIHFMNVLREDFLKGLVGMPVAGPSARAEVDILYDIMGRANYKASYLSSVESYLLYSFSSFAPVSFVSKVHERPKQESEASVDPGVRRRNQLVGNLHRNLFDCFDDNDLAELLYNAIEEKTGTPGGRAVPHLAREQEIVKMKKARQANVCTFNEFRQHLGLKPLESFEEWNPELASAARDIYSEIDKLELYPGLLSERSYCYGFGFGYTMTWGLITDIVTRIRCDPTFTSEFNEDTLTTWGFKDSTSSFDDRKESDLSFNNRPESMLRKLFKRTLPHDYIRDGAYYMFPFIVPGESVERPACLDQKIYRPKIMSTPPYDDDWTLVNNSEDSSSDSPQQRNPAFLDQMQGGTSLYDDHVMLVEDSSSNSPQQRNPGLPDQLQTDTPPHLQYVASYLRLCSLEKLLPRSPTLVQSLLTLLKKEPIEPISSKVNETTVGLMCKLLDSNDYGAISSELRLVPDVKLLLDFVLCLLDENSLQEHPMPNINRKARRFMFKVSARRPVAPRSLFITNVITPNLNQVDYVGVGGFGLVFKGRYKGKNVALKVLHRGPHFNASVKRDFFREVLAWRSLSHQYILPLLGIFERESKTFLVSPYMENGTLAGWRTNRKPSVKDIRQRVLEVAEALRYIHSEGIVHGDLRGENVLLDPSFRSQVADFGLTRHCDITLTRSTSTFSLNFAAPELFGICLNCGLPTCAGCGEGSPPRRKKTHQTDIYAYGCLYYQIYFDAVPFGGLSEFQIMMHLAVGKRPERLETPRMEDDEWNLVQSCWHSIPSERPNVQDIVKTMTSIMHAGDDKRTDWQ